MTIDEYTLKKLLRLPMEERARRVLEFGKDDLQATIRELEEPKVFQAGMTAERLAWAVAFNAEGTAASQSTSNKRQRGTKGYRAHFPSDTPWITIWCKLSLTELALSVACEHREDWQNPQSRPISLGGAEQAYNFVYDANKHKVVGYIRKYFPTLEPVVIANEAWGRVFCDYWSIKADRRFGGLARISTLVCSVAYNVGIDEIRKPSRESSPDPIKDHGDLERMLERIGIPLLDFGPNPEEILRGKQLQRHIRRCLKELPAKQRMVAEEVWFRGISQRRAADTFKITESAVSQHLKKAREALRNCLREGGFEGATDAEKGASRA